MSKQPKKRLPVTSICGIPWAKKHQPHCTKLYRKVEGCWCFLLDPDDKPLNARTWRARRRSAARLQKTWTKEEWFKELFT